jgi:ferritin-like metal-binding protein YciE
MADPTVRELKLIQYLNEAYGKEKELETALQAHITLTTRPPYKKRLQEHLKETKAQSRALERRIKKLGGTAEVVDIPGPDAASKVAGAATSAAKKGAALAKGPLHALRGTGVNEKMLKNAKTEYFNEHEEIATYTGIEALAQALSDSETAKLAREHRRQEERMARFLERLIPQLTKAVVTEEIPARDRKPAEKTTARRGTTARATASSRTAKRSSAATKRSSGGTTRRAASRSTNGASATRSTSRRRTAASGGRASRGSSGASRGSSGASRGSSGASRGSGGGSSSSS